jgi:signal transduction histidine kinase/ActR/RegA family two-component response regulator
VFAIVISLCLGWWFRSGDRSEAVGMILLAFTGVLGLAMAAVILYYTKDIMGKIKVLNEWTDSVLKGNLDATVDMGSSDDEVSRLSYSLSKMLREIKGAYSAVHKEAVEHKQQSIEHQRLAEAAQIGTKQLSDALARLKETQLELMQKERMHVVEQLVRGVVHDFGEAMMPIQGTIDNLLAYPEKLVDKAGTVQHLQTINEAVQKAGKSLKNLAGIYHLPQERSFGPADLSRLVEKTVEMLTPRWKAEANAKGIRIDVRKNLQTVPLVAGDEGDIQDAITNLVMNAVEAMPGGGTMLVSTYADKTFVTLEVRDTGKGMTQEVRKRCVEPFFSTKNGAGTGMGLTIVNSVVHRHGGSLKIESEVNKGTRVIVKLRVWDESLGGNKASTPASPSARKLVILVVDDDPLTLKVIGRNLEASGHSISTAAGGVEGLEKIKKGKFDIAIVDKAMADMDGIALANAIKEVSPFTPVVMLTGYADIMREERDIPDSIDVLLPKPVTMADLNKALNEAASGMKS